MRLEFNSSLGAAPETDAKGEHCALGIDVDNGSVEGVEEVVSVAAVERAETGARRERQKTTEARTRKVVEDSGSEPGMLRCRCPVAKPPG